MSLKSAQTAKIGKKFKSMRESLGLSESQVSAKTYINVDYITAIESGDYSIFPAKMFALRYFEKYSIFLGIDLIFFDIYDVDNIPESSEDIKKRQIKDFYPQIKIAAPLMLLAVFFIFIGGDDRQELSTEISDNSSGLWNVYTDADPQLSLFPEESLYLDELRKLNLNEMTPLQALNYLHEFTVRLRRE